MHAIPPQTPEQVIEQRLLECGLGKGGFTVKYEDYLQSIEVVITAAAGAKEDQIPCIHQAVGYEIVAFDDASMEKAYSDHVSELLRPQMLESTTEDVKKLGLLDGFPERKNFSTLEEYAQALERHSGVTPQSVLRVRGGAIIFDPPRDANFRDLESTYSKVIAVIMFATARGDFKEFGFIGNAAFAAPEGK